MSNSKTSKEYKTPVRINVTGATAPDGTPYVRIAASSKVTWTPRAAFTGGGSVALRMLNERGLPLLSEEWKQCRGKVAELTSYPAKPLIDRPGWNELHFALADGTVFARSDSKRPVVLFRKNGHKCAAAGSLKRWKKLTALLRSQPLATFVLFAAYAGPFVSLNNHAMNVGFELAGPGGTGKTTLLRLAAAVCGPTDNPLGPNYWITANAAINGLEQVMNETNDMPLIIDECNLYAAADRVAARAAKMNELVFKLSDGAEKRRFGSVRPIRSRFLFLTSTNEPLTQLLNAHRVAVAEAAADRLLTIPISAERPFGVFDCLPEGFESTSAFAECLNQGTRKCYGAVSKRLNPLKAAKYCYELNRAFRSTPSDMVEQLRKLADDFDTIRIVRGGRLSEMSDEELNEAPAIVKERRSGQHELILTQRQLEREVVNLRAFFADPNIQRVIVAEKGRRQTKRHIRSNVTMDRVYCFRLSNLD